MDLSWLEGWKLQRPRGEERVQGGGSDTPSGDPGEALGCWREGSPGEAQERVTSLLTSWEGTGAWHTGKTSKSGPRAWLPVPWASPPCSVNWHEPLVLLCETRDLDEILRAGPPQADCLSQAGA